mmetsp:Transcript_30001/g.63983  ORF Transcript_30001/g.63983 Transcript_30001/m.63983 type:complete len:118 (-) Transcript_30001:338-691(-)
MVSMSKSYAPAPRALGLDSMMAGGLSDDGHSSDESSDTNEEVCWLCSLPERGGLGRTHDSPAPGVRCRGARGGDSIGEGVMHPQASPRGRGGDVPRQVLHGGEVLCVAGRRQQDAPR